MLAPSFLLVGLLVGPATPEDDRVAVLQPSPVAPAAEVELSVTIRETPEPGAPISLRLSSDEVELLDNRFDARDVVDPHAAQPRLRARVTAPAQAGHVTVHGDLRWVVCRGEHCRVERADVTWTIEVAAL